MARYKTKIRITVKGLDHVQDKLGARAALVLHNAIEADIQNGAQKMAIDAYKNAPVETSALRVSILRSVKKEGDMEYIIGSYMPYAQRQEYEHKTKKMYLHRAVWANQPKLRRELIKTIKLRLG